MKIAVFGNFGVQNIGDDLILMGLLEELKDIKAEVIVFSGASEQVQMSFGVRAFPFFPAGLRSFVKWLFSKSYRDRLVEGFKELSSVDRILIGGGGILVDHHIQAILLWWKQLNVIRKTHKPYRFIANSFELRYGWSKKLFLPFLSQAEEISVRDSSSQTFIRSLGLQADLRDDLAFSAPLDIPEVEKEKKVVFALCRWGLGPIQRQSLKSFIAVLKIAGYKVVGLAFQTVGDDDRQIYAGIDPEMEITCGLSDILQELKSAELLVGMRFHSLILAERLNINAIAIAYQAKVSHFMKDKKKEDQLIPVADLKLDRLQALFEKRIEGREE